jgi:hypothetical protein
MIMKKRVFNAVTLVMIVVLSLSSISWVSPPGVSGGGTMLNLPEGGGRYDWNSISIWGWANGTQGSTRGSWYVTFNNTSNDLLDRARFYSRNVTEINYYAADSETCKSAVNVTAYGYLNGESGYYVILRFADGPTRYGGDTVRVTLYDINDQVVYDSHGGDFPDESSCVGSARTGLDYGNIAIKLP